MGAQPCLEGGQIELMAADFSSAVEQQRHIPAVSFPEPWVGIDVDGTQNVSACREQRADLGRHLLAQRAAEPGIERELTHP